MGYELDAILARHADIASWKLEAALVYHLTEDLGLIPTTCDFASEIKPLANWAKKASKGTMVAHLNAEFFGGQGGHDCTLWVDGESQSGLDINQVLAQFGIQASGQADAFDTVGLGRCRRNETWAAHAVVDPIQDSVEALIGALKYKCEDKLVQEKVRSLTAGRLGELKDARALPALKQSLADPEYGTRLSAACALGEIGEPAVAILTESLQAEDPWNIVFALGKAGPQARSAVPALLPLLKHADWKIRLETIQTLSSIGSVGPEVNALLKDREKLVQDAARKALDTKSEGR